MLASRNEARSRLARKAFEAALGEAKTFVKEKDWIRAQDVLMRLLDSDPPGRVARNARSLLKEVQNVMEHESQG